MMVLHSVRMPELHPLCSDRKPDHWLSAILFLSHRLPRLQKSQPHVSEAAAHPALERCGPRHSGLWAALTCGWGGRDGDQTAPVWRRDGSGLVLEQQRGADQQQGSPSNPEPQAGRPVRADAPLLTPASYPCIASYSVKVRPLRLNVLHRWASLHST